jgi:hypothetical protein
MTKAKSKAVAQPKLPGMPKATPLECASRDLLVAREELETAKENVDRKSIAMAEVMKSEGRTSFMCEGYTIAISTKPSSEKITVKAIEKR